MKRAVSVVLVALVVTGASAGIVMAYGRLAPAQISPPSGPTRPANNTTAPPPSNNTTAPHAWNLLWYQSDLYPQFNWNGSLWEPTVRVNVTDVWLNWSAIPMPYCQGPSCGSNPPYGSPRWFNFTVYFNGSVVASKFTNLVDSVTYRGSLPFSLGPGIYRVVVQPLNVQRDDFTIYGYA